MTLIDLDRPETEPAPRPGPSRARLAVAGLALVVAAAVVGGLLTDRWRTQRQQEAARSAVSVVLLPDSLPRPDDAVSPAQVDGPTVVSVELSAHVDVVNAGPAPVRFAGIQADGPGLRLRGSTAGGAGAAGTIAPADFMIGSLEATVTCSARPASGPLSVTVSVVPADGVLRRSAVDLDWRGWADQIATVCDRPAPGIWSRR